MDDQDDFTEIDVVLRPLIEANPGVRPNDLASLVLASIGVTDAAPTLPIFAARQAIRNRAADLIGVEREPAAMNADEAAMNVEIEEVVRRAIVEEQHRNHVAADLEGTFALIDAGNRPKGRSRRRKAAP